MNKYMNKSSFIYSYPSIIMAAFIFWPVAVLLIYNRNKAAMQLGLSTSKIARISAYICFMFVLAGIVTFMDGGFGGEDYGYMLFFIAGVIILFMLSNKIKDKVKRYEKYVAIINGNEVIIDNIAVAMSLSLEEVRKDIQTMIDGGYFIGAYINDSTNEIILPKNKFSMDDEGTKEDTTQSTVVVCKCCGAQNKVTKNEAECEYCGSPLQ